MCVLATLEPLDQLPRIQFPEKVSLSCVQVSFVIRVGYFCYMCVLATLEQFDNLPGI